MSPAVLLTELRQQGAIIHARDDRLVIDAPSGVLTPELRERITTHKRELLTLLANRRTTALPAFDLDTSEVTAVKLVNTVLGALWLVADEDALAEHPDIIRSGLPVFWFDEVEKLRGKTRAELQAIAMVKAAFPTGWTLQ